MQKKDCASFNKCAGSGNAFKSGKLSPKNHDDSEHNVLVLPCNGTTTGLLSKGPVKIAVEGEKGCSAFYHVQAYEEGEKIMCKKFTVHIEVYELHCIY